MPLFTMHEPQSSNPTELRSYLTELVSYLGFLLENLDGDNVPQLRRSPSVSVKLRPEDWKGDSAPYTCTLTHSTFTENGVYALIPHPDASAEEFIAFRNANLMGGKQSKGKITLKAWGEKPTVGVRVEVVGVRG